MTSNPLPARKSTFQIWAPLRGIMTLGLCDSSLQGPEKPCGWTSATSSSAVSSENAILVNQPPVGNSALCIRPSTKMAAIFAKGGYADSIWKHRVNRTLCPSSTTNVEMLIKPLK